MNRELARKVVLYALAFPEKHNQNTWVSTEDDYPQVDDVLTQGINCATTACLAGTTLLFGDPQGAADCIKGRKAWSLAAADLLLPETTNDPYNPILEQLNNAFYTTTALSYSELPAATEEERVEWANAEAIKKFAEVFDLDLDELRAEVLAFRRQYLGLPSKDDLLEEIVGAASLVSFAYSNILTVGATRADQLKQDLVDLLDHWSELDTD